MSGQSLTKARKPRHCRSFPDRKELMFAFRDQKVAGSNPVTSTTAKARKLKGFRAFSYHQVHTKVHVLEFENLTKRNRRFKSSVFHQIEKDSTERFESFSLLTVGYGVPICTLRCSHIYPSPLMASPPYATINFKIFD